MADDTTGAAAAPATKTFTEAEVNERVAGLDGKNKELLGKMKQMQSQLDPIKPFLEKLGGDPSKLEAILAANEKAEEDKQRAAGNFDAMLQQRSTEFTKKLELETANTKKFQSALFREKSTSAALEAINANDGNSALLLPHVQGRLKVVEENDQFVVRVFDANGQMMIADQTGAPLTAGQFVEKLKGDTAFAAAFNAPNASGGGAKGSGTPFSPAGVIRLTGVQARDTVLYRQARAEAEKRGVDLVVTD